MENPTKLQVLNNGPLKLEGSFNIVDQLGNRYETEKTTLFLCRCGLSQNKPFCDGRHKEGFQHEFSASK